MALRKERLKFTLKRFRGFWNEYKRSKRGILGLIILIFYIIIALSAPLLTPLEPYAPKLKGYYPAGTNPQIAARLAKPIWYKYLPGGQNLPENVFPIKNHEMPNVTMIEKEWNWTGSNCNIVASSNKGDRHDGCIEINFTSSGSAKIWHQFSYPYPKRPQKLLIHISIFTSNKSITSVEISLANSTSKEKTYTHIIPSITLADYNWTAKYVSEDSPRTLNNAFPGKGDYLFQITVTSKGKATVRLDNIDLLIYGEIFGLLGTDGNQGRPRDIFTTLIYGTRISLIVGLLSAAISTFLGLFLGLVAGYIGGVVDEFIMRFADFLLVLPTLPLLIVLIVTTSASIWNLIILLSFMGWMSFSRQVRSMVLSLRERSFIEAAKAVGASTSHIIFRHIVPNVFALVYITLATSVPGAIISEASISWLGLFDPTIVSWGRMLYEFTNSGVIIKPITEYWFWVIPPGIAIMTLAMAFILIGYALDEILNPRLRQRY